MTVEVEALVQRMDTPRSACTATWTRLISLAAALLDGILRILRGYSLLSQT